VTGEVSMPGARVGGQLDCGEATLSNPGGRALNANGLTAARSLFLRSAEVTGEVSLLGARVGSQLNCVDATLSNPGGPALELERALVTADVLMRPAQLDGSIDLRAARVGGWYDDRRTWPTALNLEGFVYDAIDAPDVTPKQRLGWLRRHQVGYLPQLYEQLASVYRRAGNDQAARMVAIAKQQARRAQARRWWVRAPSRAWSFVLRWTIGYGYRPALALPYLAGLFVIGWVVFDRAYPTELRPAKSGPEQPGFNPARYTLDLLLPVANLHQRRPSSRAGMPPGGPSDSRSPDGCWPQSWSPGSPACSNGTRDCGGTRVVSGAASDNGRLSGTTQAPASDHAGGSPPPFARLGHVIRYIC
jgi:hypothetical protein